MPGTDRPLLSDARVQELVRAILERPQYKNFRPESGDLLGTLGAKWRALMDWLLQLHDSDPNLYWVLVCALGAVCSLLVLHIVWTLRSALRSAAPLAARDEPAHEQDFVYEARALATGGHHLEAAHRLLLASLRSLAQRRHISLRPEDGNHAVCRQLTASGLPAPLRGELVALILETEQAWFGGGTRPAQAASSLYERWESAYAQLAGAGLRAAVRATDPGPRPDPRMPLGSR